MRNELIEIEVIKDIKWYSRNIWMIIEVKNANWNCQEHEIIFKKYIYQNKWECSKNEAHLKNQEIEYLKNI